MRKQTLQFDSPLDALVAVAKRLSRYEAEAGMDSEDFFARYAKGEIGDDARAVIGPTTTATSSPCAGTWTSGCMRPHSRLADYLQGVEAALGALRGVYVESYQEELLTPRRANLRIRVRFANGRLLEINEAVVVEGETLCHLDYRYHCQDPDPTPP